MARAGVPVGPPGRKRGACRQPPLERQHRAAST